MSLSRSDTQSRFISFNTTHPARCESYRLIDKDRAFNYQDYSDLYLRAKDVGHTEREFGPYINNGKQPKIGLRFHCQGGCQENKQKPPHADPREKPKVCQSHYCTRNVIYDKHPKNL